MVLTLISTVGHTQDLSQDTLDIEITNPLETSTRQYEILSITVNGASTVRPDFVENTSGLEVGSTITIPGEELTQAIERLNRTGLFSDIEINQLGATANGIDLEIRVV
ncbi:MAG: outer membrane protein assembly factor BamA, partial [Balneolaceae bacterium]|nr:outer membrane protein assembly factor BamA [Balneolaceae bacterium]